MSQKYFATTVPGLEDVLLKEVRALGGRKAKILLGGVEFEGTHAVFYRANYMLRSAHRVMLRVDEFRAKDAVELYNKTRRYEWERILNRKATIFVRASAHHSRLIHTGLISKTIYDGIHDHFRKDLNQRPPAHAQEIAQCTQLLLARVVDDRCELSLDGSGELLYRRGWRKKIGAAPIRESIAAALLELAGYEPGTPLFDPMCGSGTFVIEAAQIAAKIPAGQKRKFALWQWANFRKELWDEVVAQAADAIELPDSVYFGADHDAEMVAVSQANADAAGVASVCTFMHADVQTMTPPCDTPGLVICNPPYGERIMEDSETLNIFLKRFSTEFKSWKLAIVLPTSMPVPAGIISLSESARFRNGGIPVKLLVSSI